MKNEVVIPVNICGAVRGCYSAVISTAVLACGGGRSSGSGNRVMSVFFCIIRLPASAAVG